MREFKFRVWHKKERRWLDPWAEEDPVLSLKDCGHGCEVFTYSRERKSHDNLDCLMKDVVIQQYTSLKDKNGKEIYEGDIVEWQSHIIHREAVVFSDGVFWATDIPLYEVAKNAEVIGNMCENRGCLK